MSTSEMHRPNHPQHAGGHHGPDRRGPAHGSVESSHTGDRVLRIPAAASSVGLARAHVARAAQRLIPRSRADAAFVTALSADLQLAVSELVTNAVHHGTGPDVDVSVDLVGDTVVLTVVSSGGDALEPVERWQVAGIDSVTGRGLGIVRAVSDRVEAICDGSSVTIHVERHLPT